MNSVFSLPANGSISGMTPEQLMNFLSTQAAICNQYAEAIRRQLASTGSLDVLAAAAEAAKPAAEAAEPAAEAAEPVAEAAEPVAQAAEPVAQAAEPVAQAAEPVAQAAEPQAAEPQAADPRFFGTSDPRRLNNCKGSGQGHGMPKRKEGAIFTSRHAKIIEELRKCAAEGLIDIQFFVEDGTSQPGIGLTKKVARQRHNRVRVFRLRFLNGHQATVINRLNAVVYVAEGRTRFPEDGGPNENVREFFKASLCLVPVTNRTGDCQFNWEKATEWRYIPKAAKSRHRGV